MSNLQVSRFSFFKSIKKASRQNADLKFGFKTFEKLRKSEHSRRSPIFPYPLQNRGSRVRILLPLPQGSETRCFRLFFLAFFCFFGAFCSGMTGNREQIAILSSDYCCCRKMSFPNGCNCFFCFECFRLVQHQKSIRRILWERPRHQFDFDAGGAFLCILRCKF